MYRQRKLFAGKRIIIMTQKSTNDALELRIQELEMRIKELYEKREQLKLIIEGLRSREKTFCSMIETIEAPIYLTSQTFRIEYMNPAMVGWIGRDVTGKCCHKAIYNRNERCEWCPWDRIQKGELVEYEMINSMDNHHYSIFNSPIFDTNSKISKLTIFRDITEKKELQAQSYQIKKMKSFDLFTANISHYFNNVLYTIIGNAELAIEDLPEWHTAHTHLEAIKEVGLEAAAIINQLSIFHRGMRQANIPVDLLTIINKCLISLRPAFPPSIEIRRHITAKEVKILADQIQISRALKNIFVNAAEAMEKRGGILEIVVETITVDKTNPKRHPDLNPGDYVKISVKDTGSGIDPEIVGCIFDPYFTTKDFGYGSGLGLFVSQSIVKKHGGTIYAHSRPGKGTTMTIFLPAGFE